MTDLERALRDTLADPPVAVPANRYATYDIERRIERRRRRQKQTATSLGVAAVIAAAIAVPVATGVDLGSGGKSGSSAANGAGNDRMVHPGAAVPRPQGVPAPVWNTAQALARDYGRPLGPIQWVRTTNKRWGQIGGSAEMQDVPGTVYVLQVPNFRCTKGCPPQLSGKNARPMPLVTAIDAGGHRLSLTFDSAYNMKLMGKVNTFTVR